MAFQTRARAKWDDGHPLLSTQPDRAHNVFLRLGPDNGLGRGHVVVALVSSVGLQHGGGRAHLPL
eukprot:CAMPEP_0114538874 /NCGR_PEP_ID=MMETSP0109-20121206/30382_1 /TAXON_ID=29199 /ORGANISM="Chlorarachnion reptans, Strain CCCM449" /LENGTH=64 /DNA_ID=CAMNT_0001722935 /DNA_START=781 /DNA_END=971 /DNA_ORIENTATION=+